MKQSVVQRALVAAGFCAVVVGLSGSLTACVPLVVGGAAAGTALVATDRRTSGAQLEDEGIELRLLGRVRSDMGTRVRVNVVSYNRQVLLTGEVPNEKDKQAIEQIARKVENVGSVVNALAVMNTPSLAGRSADLLITGRLKAAILDASDLEINAIKVITEHNVVYLMGRVTKREADRVTNIARTIAGVQRVVRVFEDISEEELRRLRPAKSEPAPAPAPAKLKV
ncbi:MAG: BON domain-containing protein [Polaromonas sp.]|jgi:osmotically-inducible protein OsmY|nr:BON domain-containing protein [Polaromonas sp.]MBP8088072.1 BON domain-containing protein [Polaromonas sp.]